MHTSPSLLFVTHGGNRCSSANNDRPGPFAQGFLQSLADATCSTGVVNHGSRLKTAQQCLSCALVRGRGIVFRYSYQSIAKRAGKDFRKGAVVPRE